jgi:flagella basal body P-ring formation protein FlgA
MIRAFLGIVLIFLSSAVALAETGPPLTGRDIAGIVRAVLAEHGQEGESILADQRRYFPCETALTVAPRLDGRWDAVDVICPGAIPWSIVVRTSAAVPKGFSFGNDVLNGPETSLVILRQAMRRGEVITAEKLGIAEIQRAPASGIFTAIGPLVGRRMAYAVGAGVPLLDRHLEMVWSVRANEPIVIEINTGSVVVAMAGVALENGQTGDIIRVRNSRSERVVVGRVGDEKKIIVTPNMN